MQKRLVLIMMIKNFKKLYITVITLENRGAAHNICHLRYKTPKEITLVFHNGSKYDYHFIIKE